MPDLGLKSFDKLYPMMIRKYQDLIVDQNASEADKINSIILKLNALGKLSNDVVRDWNTVYNWAMNDGLTTDVSNKIELMKSNGELTTILQGIFNALTGDMTTLHTTAKDTLVNSINEVDDLAKSNQTSLAQIALQAKGLVGDGVADDTTAIQTALNSLPVNVTAKGVKVKLPSGKYKITSLNIPNGVYLEGDLPFDPKNMTGTWFYCTDQTNSAIILNSGSGIRNIAFYYPNQSWDSTNSKPLIAYPSTIQIALNATRMFIEKIFFLNSYYGIDADRHHESLTVQDVNGYCMNLGLVADFSSDIDRFINVHFNYNALAVTTDTNATNYGQWTRKNGTAFTIKQADWTVLSNCFAWGYRKTYVLTSSPNGVPSGVHFSKCGADATGQILNMSTGWGIDVSEMFGTCFYPTAQFGATEGANDTDTYAIYVSGGNDFSLNNSRFWGVSKGLLFLTCDQTNIIGNTFKDFGGQANTNNMDVRAITLNNGQHNIIGNQFKGNNYARVYGILMNTAMSGATILGNSFWNFATNLWCIQSAGAVSNFEVGVNNYYNCPNTVGMTGNETNYTYYSDKNSFTSGNITASGVTAGAITATAFYKMPTVTQATATGANEMIVDSADNKLKYKDNVGRWNNIALQQYGATGSRPTGLVAADTGFYYYDTTLNKPVWWNGSAWKDATGTTV